MSEKKIPEFMLMDVPKEPSEGQIWLHRYYKKFGPPGNFGLCFSKEEYTEIYKKCVESNMTLHDYLNIGEPEEDDEI